MDNNFDAVKNTYDSNAACKQSNYTVTHAVFALCAFVIGSLWYKWFFEHLIIYGEFNHALKTVFTVIFTLFTVLFFVKRKAEFNNDALFFLVFSLVISLRYTIYYNETNSIPSMLAGIVLHVSMLLYLKCMGYQKTLDNIVSETAKAVFAEPFISFHTVFASLSAFFKRKDSDDENKESLKKLVREMGLIIVGVVIAVPIVFAVFSLLISDSFFEGLLEGIGDVFNNIHVDFNLFEYVNPITVLVAMYIYGAMFSADKRRCQVSEETDNDYGILPGTVIKTVLVSLICVYVLFVVAQLAGFTSMINGVPPAGYTYADFARSGFFELCAVACINGAVLFCSGVLACKKDEKKHGELLRYMLVGFTLFLIATAASKMCLYISVYGFTPKRFYTLWFMILLAVLFVMTLFKLKNNVFKLSRYSVYVACAFLIVLFMIDFEGLAGYFNNMYFAR